MSGAVLTARGVDAGYRRSRARDVTVVRQVDADLHPGELACLLGANGAGKSTLLRTLVGAQRPLAGQVALGGEDLHRLDPRRRARRLSVVLTDRIEVGYLTARELVQLGRSPRSGWLARLGAGDHEAVDWALAAAGAAGLARRQVHELSDGERQRVMIARALAQEPDVLVLDEPTAFLDLTRRVELLALLRELTATAGLAVLLSTHELELALRHADAVWLVQPDHSFECGAPEDLAFGGAIARTYAGAGIAFDDEAGTFTANGHDTGGVRGLSIRVDGDVRARRWASRAAVRAGWHPSPHGRAHLTATNTPTGVRWLVRLTGADATGTGFASLVDHLRTTHCTGASP